MYEHGKSKYCYPDSDVLINIPGFKKQEQLDAYERIVTTDRLRILGVKPLKGNFDLVHLCAIHQFIFKDVYPFAGKLRVEDISKGSFRFGHVRFLLNQTNQLFFGLNQDGYLKGLMLDEFIDKLTYYMTELNVLHPFREGNGRTQREFFRCLAKESGYSINWADVDASAMLTAMIRSPYDNSLLRKVLYELVTK